MQRFDAVYEYKFLLDGRWVASLGVRHGAVASEVTAVFEDGSAETYLVADAPEIVREAYKLALKKDQIYSYVKSAEVRVRELKLELQIALNELETLKGE